MSDAAANPLTAFFGVVASPRPYLAALYLLLAMPLGIVYFVFLAVGLTTGLGLTIIWVGLVILLLVLLLGLACSALERQQAIWLLGGEVGPVWRGPFRELGFKAQFKALLTNPVTWKGLVFLLLKFPLGLASFIFTVVAFSVSLALFAAPLLYRFEEVHLGVEFWSFRVDTLGEALVASVVGFVLLLLTLHTVNGFAWVWRRLSQLLLGNRELPTAV